MWRERSLWVAMAAVLYVAVAALRADPNAPIVWTSLVVGPLCLILGFRAVAPPAFGVDRIEPAARSAARVTVAGLAIALVADLAPSGPAFQAAKTFGVALACPASLVALVRVSSLGGIAASQRRVRHEAAALSAAMWTAAVGLFTAQVMAPALLASVNPLIIDYAVVTASLASIGITLVAAFQLYVRRRFELGVAERAAAALWLGVLCLALGVFAALLSVASPERSVQDAALAAALCVSASSISQRPTQISRILRTAVAVTMLCAPLVCVAVVVAYKAPTHAGLILFVVTIAAASMGLLTPKVAHRLAPERGVWLKVLDDAIVAAKEPDPRQAVIAVLTVIRDGLDADPEGGALHRIATGDRLVVDRAGYLHTEPARFPMRLVEIAEQEPERVLSTETLRYIRVQRPAVRELVSWLDARAAGATALVFDEEVCVGALVWPAAGRTAPLAYEEVVLLRRLADHLGTATGAAAQLARSRAREQEAEIAMARAEAQVSELTDAIERSGLRQRALSEHLARPAQVASYSPAAQTAHQEAERLGQGGLPVTLVAPPGVETICWAAVIHLASARKDGTLLVVDATVPGEQSLERWSEPSESPLQVAREGTLVILDAHVLPTETQRYIGSALASDAGIVVVLPSTVDAMVAAELIDEHLADRLGDRALVLPLLAQRAEDLRALALHKLSRIGVRLRARPFGLTLPAQQVLNEYPWPGNEAELEAVLVRAALKTDGDAVDAEQLAEVIGDPSLAETGPKWAAGSGS
jgi:hypothetical protein